MEKTRPEIRDDDVRQPRQSNDCNGTAPNNATSYTTNRVAPWNGPMAEQPLAQTARARPMNQHPLQKTVHQRTDKVADGKGALADKCAMERGASYVR
jgi:hypothetical protein